MQLLTTRRLDLVPLDLTRDLDDLHAMFEDPRLANAGYTERSRSQRDTLARLNREFGDNGGWTWLLRIRPAETAPRVTAMEFQARRLTAVNRAISAESIPRPYRG